jgi:uroporphyrinogen-III synthase
VTEKVVEQAFAGRSVAVPETRQLDVLADLLEARGADVVRCPLVAIKDSPDADAVTAWLARFVAEPPALLVIYTGEGLERLLGFAERVGIRDEFAAALARTRKLSRGPKPKRALRRLALTPEIEASAPTTAGIIATLDGLEFDDGRIAVQRYGAEPIPELEQYLAARGAHADWVSPYVYASAADDAEVVALIERLERGGVDAIAFTSKAQIERLMAVARERGLLDALEHGLKRTYVAAVGPVAAEALAAVGVTVDAMPTGSYFMKPLVRVLAEGLAARA